MNLIKDINDGIVLKNPKHIERYVSEFKEANKEHFIVLGLNTANKVLYRDVVSIGTLNQSIVHPRETFRTAILKNCNSIICVHNHPSGDMKPSSDDLKTHKTLKQAGDLLGIKVIDSIIISQNGIESFDSEV